MEKYCVNLPYSIVEGKVSQCCLNSLMEVFGGRVSELTLEQTYRYAYFLSLGQLREVLRQIIDCKRVHINKLAEAIITFGGLPLYSGEKTFWSGGFVEYSAGKTCLNNILSLEEKIIEKYEKIIDLEQNQSLKKLISRVIMDSRLHITTLKAFTEEV